MIQGPTIPDKSLHRLGHYPTKESLTAPKHALFLTLHPPPTLSFSPCPPPCTHKYSHPPPLPNSGQGLLYGNFQAAVQRDRAPSGAAKIQWGLQQWGSGRKAENYSEIHTDSKNTVPLVTQRVARSANTKSVIPKYIHKHKTELISQQ